MSLKINELPAMTSSDSSQPLLRGISDSPCKKILHRYLPITKWLPRYSLYKLQCDMIGGITVGLMVIPQGLAYATIAGLPAVYGLYSAFMGCFMYCIFGTSKDVSIGPTAIMSLIVDTYSHYSYEDKNTEYAIALAFFSGLIQFGLGFFRFGFLVRFISIPVISGFTSAAAITIAVGQIKYILGLKHVRRDFIPCVYDIFTHLSEFNKWDFILGMTCIIILLILRQLGRTHWPNEEDPAVPQKVSRKLIWLVGTGRNFIVVLMAALVAYAVESQGYHNAITITGDITPGLPSFKPPPMTITSGNVTYSTGRILSDLGPGLAIVPLIGFLESIAIAKAFARKNKYKVDASQELIALGLANVFSSFVSSYPVTGSFSRTAVNAQSGVATPAGGIFTGAIVILALGVLTPFFKYIPKASLAALIISSVLTMVEYHIVPKIWRVKKIDLLPLFVTFFACFYEIEIGILCGIGISLAIFLYPVIWPTLAKAEHDYTTIKIKGELSYAGIEYIASEIEDASYGDPTPKGIIVDLSMINHIDFTVTQSLLMVIEEMTNRNLPIFFSKVQAHISETLVDSGVELRLINPSPDVLEGAINPV